MNQFSNEKDNHNLIQDLSEENSFLFKENMNLVSNFFNTNEINSSNHKRPLLGRKRKKDINDQFAKKHTKYSLDNLKNKCKHLVIENVMRFINGKIYQVYEGNIGNGLTIKRLMKMNQTQKVNSDVEFNKKFIKKTLKDIFSQDITQQINLHDQDHNKTLIDTLLSEKKDEFEKLFNLTFIECVEHFIGNKQIEELRGLRLFSELKEEILKKYEKDGENYYNNLQIFLKDFENRINKAKPRKKRKKKNLDSA